MNHESISQKRGTKQKVPVVPYPDGYKGQALLPELILFSPELPSCPIEYSGFFWMLLTEYAKEVGCGNTEASCKYLAALESGEIHFWCHAVSPEIVLVSKTEKIGKKRERLLRIMPRKQLIELLRPTSSRVRATVPSERVAQSDNGTCTSKKKANRILH